MIKLSTSTTQTIKFIPRQGIIECVVIENEATSEQVKLDLYEVVEVLGEELVTNGGFDDASGWGVQESWNIEDGKATYDGSSTIKYIYQNSVLKGDVGVKYSITFTVVEGVVQLYFGAGSSRIVDYNYYNIGTHTITGTSEGSSTTLRVYAKNENQAIFGGSIDNISVKEVTQDTEIHYTTLDNHTELEINVTEGFLQEGQTYTLKALDSSSNILFYDKVFCTDQTDYTINKDEYKTYSQGETYKTFKG